MFGDKFAADLVLVQRSSQRAPLKNAQEAQEAIRPAEFEGSFRTPRDGAEGKKLSLYTLIYKRTLASVMQKADFMTKTYTVTSDLTSFKECEFNEVSFRSSETEMLFTGFNEALYMKDDGTQGKVKRYNSCQGRPDRAATMAQFYVARSWSSTAEFYADVDEDMVEDNNDDDDNNNDDDASSNNDMLS